MTGRESNVLHAAAGRVPQQMIMRSRDYDDDQWRHYSERLAQRGLLDGDGDSPTPDATSSGRSRTPRPACTVGTRRTGRRRGRGAVPDAHPVTRTVVAAGDVPAATPMGLSRDDLDDDSAHMA